MFVRGHRGPHSWDTTASEEDLDAIWRWSEYQWHKWALAEVDEEKALKERELKP